MPKPDKLMQILYIKSLLMCIAFLFLPMFTIAQIHDIKAGNCRYYKKPTKAPKVVSAQASDERSCSICSADRKKEMAVREAEDKRRAAAEAEQLQAKKNAEEVRQRQDATTPKLGNNNIKNKAGVIGIELKGKNYTVTRDMPAELSTHILGLYLCDTRNGSPVVELAAGGVGRFQRHQVPADDIEYWIDCDEQGAIRKLTGPTGNYQITLLYRYTSGDRKGYYDLMGVTVVLNGFGLPINNRPEITGPKYAVIYGERYKPIN